MDFPDPDIEKYAEAHTSPQSDVLEELNRETHLKVLQPRMLSGHLQGRVLSLLAHLHRPQRVLEIGTYTGYSAICMAEGLADGGEIDTIDHNEELRPMVEKYLDRAGLTGRVHLHIGEATEVIPRLDHSYDLVFIDADKENYSRYYDLVFDKVRPGGLIIADNVLWSGKVLDEQQVRNDADTRALVDYNTKVRDDERVENVLLPIRDGLLVARKLSE